MQGADYDKDLQQLKKAAEKEAKAFAKKIQRLSRKSSALANRLSDSKLKEVISAGGTLLQIGFFKQFGEQQKLLAEQFAEVKKVQRSMYFSKIEEVLNSIAQPVLPDKITRTKARALIAAHSGIDYSQVEKLPFSHYLELFKHAIEVEKSRNQPIEDLKKMMEDLMTQIDELVSKNKELSPEGLDFQKGLEIPSVQIAKSNALVNGKPKEKKNRFQKNGDIWTIVFDGVEIPNYKDAKGLSYLAYLLSHPGDVIGAVTLRQAVFPGEPFESSAGLSSMTDEQLEEHNLRKGNLNDGIPRIEPDEKKKLWMQLQELKEKYANSVKEGDDKNAARFDREITEFKGYLRKTFDKFGHPRETGGAIEKARSAISKNISNQLKKIKKDCPALFDHLIKKKCLRTGTTFSYAPPPQHNVDWEISY